MRLTHMYYLMKNNFDALEKLEITEYRQDFGNRTQYQGEIHNWLAAKEALINVQPVPFCYDIAVAFLNHREFQTDSDNFRIAHSIYEELRPLYDTFLSHMKGVLEFCSSIGLDDYQYGFDVKLPPTEDFSELLDYMSKFQKLVLSCPYLKSGDEKITFLKSDIGSTWLCFSVTGIVAGATMASIIINNLQKIIDKSIKIKSHILTCKAQEAQLRAAYQKEDVIKSVMDGYAEYKEILLNQCVEDMESEVGELNNGEERTATAKAIETLGELMSKGLEIYAAIDPSAISAQDLFPTSDKIQNLPEPVKMLTGEATDN